MDVKITPITEVDELFNQYPGEFEQQPCVLILDLSDGELTASYKGEIGNGQPASVYHGRTVWIDIPCLTAAAANELMEQAKPLAQRILDGSEIVWNGNNHVGEQNEDAAGALEELAALCHAENFDGAQLVSGWSTADWFSEGDESTISSLDITADTTDDELKAKSAEQVEIATTASADVGYGVLDLDDTVIYLRYLRDQCRQIKRDELEDVAEQLGALTERRDDLIRQIRAWDTDSDRTIGALAGLSHTAVQKIAVR